MVQPPRRGRSYKRPRRFHPPAASAPALMFDLHPWPYAVRACAGPLLEDGVEVAAITHRGEVLLSGVLTPDERVEALIDQLRRLWEKHHGPLTLEGLPSFVVDLMRQLNAQGGEAALLRLGKGARHA